MRSTCARRPAFSSEPPPNDVSEDASVNCSRLGTAFKFAELAPILQRLRAPSVSSTASTMKRRDKLGLTGGAGCVDQHSRFVRRRHRQIRVRRPFQDVPWLDAVRLPTASTMKRLRRGRMLVSTGATFR